MASQLARLTPRRLYAGLKRRVLARARQAFLKRPSPRLRRGSGLLFIVGAPRTGSSFIVRALTNAAGFVGMAEGHVTPLIAAIDRTVVEYYAYMRAKGLLDIPENTIANISEDRLRRELLRVFERFDRGLFPFARRVLDKTVNVEAIAALPMLLAAWPGSKVLYLKRDGIENVISAEHYFNVSLNEACVNWTACGEQWDRIRPQVPADAYVELDHWEITDHPEEVTNRLAEHLGLRGRETRRLRGYLFEASEEWHGGRKRRPALTEMGWSPERMQEFISICGEQMVAQGYATAVEVEAAVHPETVHAASAAA